LTGVCTECGRTFEVPAATQEKYPGWVPPKCPDCFRGSGGGRSGGGSGSGARGGAGRSTRSSGGREEHLPIADVLERYTEGPDEGVFTDGSAIPNPGPGGWGAVYVVDGEVVAQRHGHDPDTTNNRMELTAIIEGIGLVPEGRPAVLHTDSRLAVDTLTRWAAGWERRGWRRKSGPVENLDLVKQAYGLVRARPEIDVRWVKAHAGNRWNEYADSLATAWARDEL
jgi:ribonuclease HI